MKYYGLSLIAVLFLLSCKKYSIDPSFYYWRTKVELSAAEKNIIKELHVKHLYVRFFDVDIPRESVGPEPVGVIEQVDSVPEDLSVIPVVFITNRTFLKLTQQEVDELAQRVVLKINSIKADYKELQFDCDWSGKTKENYFLFLEEVKKQLPKHVSLTCTIRLHQIKYPKRTGIPPVERGMMMFYNMGDLSKPLEGNSIYNKENAEKYIETVGKYAFPLDIALPVFRWYAQYRNGSIVGLVSKHQVPDVENAVNFVSQEKNTTFISQRSFFENGIYYKEGDLLKCEALSDEELLEATRMLRDHVRGEDRRIVFYDLDELNLKHYDETIFEEILDHFN